MFATGLVKGRWKVVRKIGQGAFGEIYQGKDVVSSNLVAIKIERADSKKQVLKLEVAVIKKLQSCPYVVRFITCGRHGIYNYMVMDLLGDNLSDLRRNCSSNGKLSLGTTLGIGIQLLELIKQCHGLGYLHRDIKPSNFAMGRGSDSHSAFMIDFGLARRYLLPSGKVRPAREQAGFRGTARYASIHSHNGEDLSRRDDLWSLFYLLVEFATGQLPWRRIKDKDRIHEMKMRCNSPELVADLPPVFLTMMRHLQELQYEDKPDYEMLHEELMSSWEALGGGDMENCVWDWEKQAQTSTSGAVLNTRTLSSLSRLCLVKTSGCLPLIDPTCLAKLPTLLKDRLLKMSIQLHHGRLPPQHIINLLDEKTIALSLDKLDSSILSDQLVQTLVHRCRYVTRLDCGVVSDSRLRALLSSGLQCKNVTHFSLRADPKFTNSKGIRILVDCCSQLSSISLAGSDKLNDKMVELILRSCPMLTSLDLSGCKKVKGTCFKVLSKRQEPYHISSLKMSYCELSKVGFKMLVRCAIHFESLHFAPFASAFKVTGSDFLGLLARCTKVHTLELKNYHFAMDSILVSCSTLPCLTSLSIDGVGMTDYGIQCVVQRSTNLCHLSFQYGDGVSDVSLQEISRCPLSLKSLKLEFWNKFSRHSISDHSIRQMLSSKCCSSLNHLSLKSCVAISGMSFPDSVTLQSLSKLDLSDCCHLNDPAVLRIAKCAPSITELILDGIVDISGQSLHTLSKYIQSLKSVSVQHCPSLLDDDLILYLRASPQVILRTTRYCSADLRPTDVCVCVETVVDLFKQFPSEFQDKAFERAKRRSFLTHAHG